MCSDFVTLAEDAAWKAEQDLRRVMNVLSLAIKASDGCSEDVDAIRDAVLRAEPLRKRRDELREAARSAAKAASEAKKASNNASPCPSPPTR